MSLVVDDDEREMKGGAEGEKTEWKERQKQCKCGLCTHNSRKEAEFTDVGMQDH